MPWCAPRGPEVYGATISFLPRCRRLLPRLRSEESCATIGAGGASVPKTMWFNTKRNGSLAVLKIEGKKVTKVGEVDVGGLPEGVVFSHDGKYLYVGNYTDRDVSILKVEGATVTDTGKRFRLPGQPASMRGAAR